MKPVTSRTCGDLAYTLYATDAMVAGDYACYNYCSSVLIVLRAVRDVPARERLGTIHSGDLPNFDRRAVEIVRIASRFHRQDEVAVEVERDRPTVPLETCPGYYGTFRDSIIID